MEFKKILKCYILIVSGLIALCGIGLILNTLLWLNLEDYVPSDDYINYVKYFKYGLYGIGAWLIEIGIIGVLSAWKQNRCVILLYLLQIIFYALIFLLIGVGITFFLRKVVDDLSCDNLDIFEDADTAIQRSGSIFCTDQCPCNCNNAEILTYLAIRNTANAALNLNTNDNTATTNANPSYISATGVIKSQDCICFDSTVGTEYHEIAKVLGFVEEKYSCSGLCSKNSIYLFSNINNGVPQHMCWEKIIDEMKKFINIMGSFGLAFGGILLITVVMSFFLCCKSKNLNQVQDETDYNTVNQKNSETNFYEQKIDDDF